MKVALFGGTGFIGSYLVDELLDQGHEPVLLVRPGSEDKVLSREQCKLVHGDVGSVEAIEGTLAGCEAAIYAIGIIRQFPRRGITFEELHHKAARRIMEAAGGLGVKRFILLSANGVRSEGTAYQRTKYQAEQFLKTTSLDWTIFRPSVVFGDPRGQMEFCTQLRDQLIRLPLPAPLFYQGLLPLKAGAFEVSPIHVKDVAHVMVQALSMTETVGQTYELGGGEIFEWKSVIRMVGAAIGKSKWTVPVPAFAVKAAAALMGRFAFFPITRDQLDMLLEGNTCDSTSAFELFGLLPTPFDLERLSYLASNQAQKE